MCRGVGRSASLRKGHTQISAYFGTHNWESTRLVLEEMVRNGLGEIVEQHAPNESLKENVDLEGSFVVKIGEGVVQRVAMGQLYGTAAILRLDG